MSGNSHETLPVRLLAFGATTSLGTAVQASAAARAGTVRAQPLDDTLHTPEETGRPVPVTGHVAPWARGFEGEGRLLQLAFVSLEDLRTNSEPDAVAPGSRTALFLVTSPDPTGTAAASEGPNQEAAIIARRIAGRVMREIGHAPASPDPTCMLDGRTGTLRALRDAARALHAKVCDRALVLVVDSLSDPNRVAKGLAARHIKHDDNPVGYSPGEAAVALLMVRAMRNESACIIHPPVEAREPPATNPTIPPSGRAIAEATTNALSRARLSAVAEGTVYADLNGAVAAAQEWGHALVRLPLLRGWTFEFPAVNFGETGAAAPALGIVLAARAAARKSARSRASLVVSAAADGTRGAIVLETNVLPRVTHG